MDINDIQDPEERKGVEMIQALLNWSGESEPVERSLENWRNFSKGEKAQTEWAHKFFVSKE